MGYSTDFTGTLTVQSGFSDAEIASLNTFFYTDMRDLPDNAYPGPDGAHYPGYHCDLEASDKGLEWNGSEKTYDLAEWVEWVLTHRTELVGKTVNGTLQAEGERPPDRWELVVEDNQVWENVWGILA